MAKRTTVTISDNDLHDWIATQAERSERTVPNFLAWLARKEYLETVEQQPKKQAAIAQ